MKLLRRFSLLVSWYLLVINLSIFAISIFILNHDNQHFSDYYSTFESNLLQHPINDIQIQSVPCNPGYTNILSDSQTSGSSQKQYFVGKFGPACVCLSKFTKRARDDIFQSENSDVGGKRQKSQKSKKKRFAWGNKSIIGIRII